MQQKLCLWLVLVVLFGALALGNPLLPCGSATPAASGASSAVVAPATAPSPSPESPSPSPSASPVAVAPAAVAARLAGAGDGIYPRAAGVPALAIAPSRGSGAIALRATAADAALLPACPDPDLEALVVATELVGNETVWVLRDGRRLVRNPTVGALPLLVPFGDGK